MPYIPRAACLTCNVEYKITKTGVVVGVSNLVGPYYVIHADRYKCTECDREILVGFAQDPSIVRHHDGFGRIWRDTDTRIDLKCG